MFISISGSAVKKVLPAFFVVTAAALAGLPNGSPARAACAYPADVLDLTNWKQTLPTGSSGSPTEIKQSALATYFNDPFFKVNSSCDSVRFRAPVNGVTTSGSSYPRSELREMTDGGKTNASWSTTSGVHTMFIDQAITSVPQSKKHVVAGQIHDSSDDVIVIRLEDRKLFVDINGTDGPVLDPSYSLGKRFTVRFVAAEGKIKVYYNGSQTPAYTLNKSGSGNYFKAGAYTQSNCSKESVCSGDNFGEVVIYNLSVQHQAQGAAPIEIFPSNKPEPVNYVAADKTAAPIHRFWSDSKSHHFYTVDSGEKDHIIANDGSWTYEGARFASFPVQKDGTVPVYRFWSESKQGHFFTVDSQEKEHLETNDKSWKYEGVAFYAYGAPRSGAAALHRFWSDDKQGHFYTMDNGEKDFIIANDKSWKYEGIAYYVPE